MCAAGGKFFLILTIETSGCFFSKFHEIILLVHKTTVTRISCPGPPNSIIQDVRIPIIRRYVRHDLIDLQNGFCNALPLFQTWIGTPLFITENIAIQGDILKIRDT